MEQRKINRLKKLVNQKPKLKRWQIARKLGYSEGTINYTIRLYGMIPIERRL